MSELVVAVLALGGSLQGAQPWSWHPGSVGVGTQPTPFLHGHWRPGAHGWGWHRCEPGAEAGVGSQTRLSL